MKNRNFNLFIEPQDWSSFEKINELQSIHNKNSPICVTVKYRLWVNNRFLIERFYPNISNNQTLCEEFNLDCSLLSEQITFKIETFNDFSIKPNRFQNLDSEENLRLGSCSLICLKIKVDDLVSYPNSNHFSFQNK
jgi:hypothetical protein